MSQLDKTFPTMDCSICILAPKMMDVARSQNIKLLPFSELKEVRREPGNFSVRILRKQRFVNEEKCTACNDCTDVCPVLMPNEFDMDLGKRKAIYRPFPQAIPNSYSIDKKGIPACKAACPAGVNVQGYIALIREGKFKEALKLIRKDNPLPLICGRVCFHQCENECERSSVDEPVAINALKRFLTDWELEHEEQKEPISYLNKQEEKIAIVGSGPAGLTAAHELITRGYQVTIFESSPKPGGMLRTGIPEYRLPKKLLEIEIKRIQDLGVKIRTNITVGKDFTIKQLKQKGFKAILLAIGAQKSRKLDINGENLQGVVSALSFLKDVNLEKQVEVGARVVVIGGGNAAIDAARSAVRLGAKDVKVLYRRSIKEIPAYSKEVTEAKKEGVKFQFLASPKTVLGKNKKVVALECVRTRLGDPDDSGRRQPIPVKDSEFVLDVDTIIIAVGETPDISLLPKQAKLKMENILDSSFFEDLIPGIFVAGDVISGPASVIDAIESGKHIAITIHNYLRDIKSNVKKQDSFKLVSNVPKEGLMKLAKQVMPTLSLEKRIENFQEVDLGLTEEMAIKEASRCLNCGGCCECLECEKVCEPEAILHDQKEEILDLKVGAIIVATGFVPFDPSKIKEYGYGKHQNVVTSMELERLLCASGPTNGKLVRPSDGKTPHKIAFIQCVGSRSLKDNLSYCSSVCCMYATKEAVLIKEHGKESEVSVFYTDIRAFGKGFREFVNRAKKDWGIDYFRAKPSEVREDPKTQDLILNYEDTLTGSMESLQVNLVVLSTAMLPPLENREFAMMLGVRVDEYGFFQVRHSLLAPLDSTTPGIFLCGCCHNPQDIPDSVLEGKGAAARAVEFIAGMRTREKIN
jgi:heterodisulfide reductase subunit A-like polyferredoxin